MATENGSTKSTTTTDASNGSTCVTPTTDEARRRRTRRVLSDVEIERARQRGKWGEQHHPDGTFPYLSSAANVAREQCDYAARNGRLTWKHILAEEFYEAISETEWPRLRKELVQVAAVAVAWVEDGDARANSLCEPARIRLARPVACRSVLRRGGSECRLSRGRVQRHWR